MDILDEIGVRYVPTEADVDFINQQMKMIVVGGFLAYPSSGLLYLKTGERSLAFHAAMPSDWIDEEYREDYEKHQHVIRRAQIFVCRACGVDIEDPYIEKLRQVGDCV